MSRRHPPDRHKLPRRWLMTDPRMGDALWPALTRLPRGSGIIFRHYALSGIARRDLLRRVRKVARARKLMLVVAGKPANRPPVPTHGRHPGALTAPVHDRREAIAAIRNGARLLFASPVFATRSHPGEPALGRVRLGLMLHGLPVPVIALGGMDERRWRSLRSLNIHGWAGIDAWLAARPRDQKRIAVPT